jgi:putative copper export protein
MISPDIDSLRLYLHVLSISVWVGGQITLAGLVPTIRQHSPQTLPFVARAFARLAWPAFFLAVFTGMWSIFDLDPSQQGSAFTVTFAVKFLLIVAGAIATLAHSRSDKKVVIALGGAIGLLTSLIAMFLGILLAAGH